jgi:hypothetical protein
VTPLARPVRLILRVQCALQGTISNCTKLDVMGYEHATVVNSEEARKLVMNSGHVIAICVEQTRNGNKKQKKTVGKETSESF